MSTFEIAVILINYNSSEHTINCVSTIIDKTDKNVNYQLIITDNCSKEDDYLKLKKFIDQLNMDNVALHRNAINAGFGGGNSFALQFADATYLAFVNNDTLLLNDCLSILKKALESNEKIGVAGAQAYKEDGSFLGSLDHFASPAREILGRDILELLHSKKYPNRKKKYEHPIQVNYIPGSFMFFRSADFYKIGGFDENIFLYYEETDLCLRLNKINKFAFLIPEAEFIHFHGASTEKSLAIKKELKISLMYIMRKHYGTFGYTVVRGFLLIKYGFSSFFKKKNRALFSLILRGAPLSESLKYKQ